MNINRLQQAGIDYKGGLARFLGDQELYETVLMAFLTDDNLEKARLALGRGDREALFSCAHELKGSSGNSNMTGLYAASCELVSLLRGGADIGGAETAAGFARFEKAYNAAREGIKEASEA